MHTYVYSEDVEIDWIVKRGVSVDRRKEDLQGSRLTLYALRRSDQGDYVCVGINSQGRAQFTFQLVIYGTTHHSPIYTLHYTVSQNNDTDITHYNFITHQLILVIFGRGNAERICYRRMICYPTSSN